MLSLLRRLFSGRPDPVPWYRIFTRRYDLMADARSYADRLPPLTADETTVFEVAREDFRLRTLEWRAHMAPALAAAVEGIRGNCDRAALADATVTLLVDHSGSLRGWGLQTMTLVVPLIEALVTAVGMDVEVLG
jgi:hypothetical protein